MKWIVQNKNNKPPKGAHICAFSPIYPKGHPKRFRVMDSSFLQTYPEIVSWADLEAEILDEPTQ